MTDDFKTSVDVAGTLEDIQQVTKVQELDTSGIESGPLGQVHPIGWTAAGVLVLAVIFHIKGSDWLIGNLAWWHWVGLILLVAISLRPEPIKALSLALDRPSDFFEKGANSFEHPRAAFIVSAALLGLAGLLVGPLISVADWIFGVDVEPVGTSEFLVTSSGVGWLKSIIAGIVLVAAVAGLYRVLKAALPAGEIPITTGALAGLAAFAITGVVVSIISGWQDGITTGLAIGILTAGLAVGLLWVTAWGIFLVIFFYVVTRYSARFIEADIIIGEVNSLGLQLFGLLALLGVGYGVKAGVNPRIDFWWAEFSNRRKAWLDFVLHALLFVPFLWAALRLLHGYAKTSLGYKKDFSGASNGDWPASWHVWESWAQSPDAGSLPVGPVRAMIFVGFILFLMQMLSEMIKGGFVLIRREDLADLKQVDAPSRVE